MKALTLVTVCPRCGATLDVTSVEGGATWNEAVLWGYLAQRNHVCREPVPS